MDTSLLEEWVLPDMDTLGPSCRGLICCFVALRNNGCIEVYVTVTFVPVIAIFEARVNFRNFCPLRLAYAFWPSG